MDESESRGTKSVWVPMVDPEIVKQLRALHALGWGSKRIAVEFGISRNSVRRYIREGAAAETQTRPKACTLDESQRELAQELLGGPAQGHGVVVHRSRASTDLTSPSTGDLAQLIPPASSEGPVGRAQMWMPFRDIRA